MGTTHPKKKAAKEESKAQYIKFLKKKQQKFARDEQKSRACKSMTARFSFISEADAPEIDWKVFYQKFLKENAESLFWATPMLKFFQGEFVQPEKRWIDIMFYEKFTHSLVSRMDDELNIDFSLGRHSVLVNKMFHENESPTKGSHTPRLAQSDDQDSIVRSLAQAINKSLRKRRNPFQILIGKFRELFVSNYTKKTYEWEHETSYRGFKLGPVRLLSPEETDQVSKLKKGAMSSIEEFIKLTVQCLSLFYKPVIGEEKLVYLRELITNSVLNCVVRGDVYHLLFFMTRSEHDAEEAAISRKLRKMRECKPQDLGINEYLCLNETSPLLKVAKESVERVRQDTPDTARDTPPRAREKSMEEVKLNLNLPLPRSVSTSVSESSLQTRLTNPPYREAIDWLETIARARTPLKKFKYISQMNKVIGKCVDRFWRGTHVDPELLRIDADQYILIMLYIMSKGKVRHLFSHITLASEFASMGTRSEYDSYCLTTFQACYCHLMSEAESPKSATARTARTATGWAQATVLESPENRNASLGCCNASFSLTLPLSTTLLDKKERRKVSQ